MKMPLPVNQIVEGDALKVLQAFPDESVNCVVTSPPYWGLRDYGVEGQIGLETDFGVYVGKLTQVFKEVRRVLRDDGTCWINLGDSYANVGKWGGSTGGKHVTALHGDTSVGRGKKEYGILKPKDLCGIPWHVAFALQFDGWWLRSDIIWAKRQCMPESVQDRPTRAHEYIFLLTKSERYYYDAEAIREPDAGQDHPRNETPALDRGQPGANPHKGIRTREGRAGEGRNKRSVWSVSLEPFPDAHFAVFPTKLIEPCIMAGCPAGGVVLDPFMGAGTTALVALKAGRQFVGIELNPKYVKLAEERIWQEKNQARLA